MNIFRRMLPQGFGLVRKVIGGEVSLLTNYHLRVVLFEYRYVSAVTAHSQRKIDIWPIRVSR
ncbi:hypothetical protein PISMIDRAFT_547493 [Pisolithus microcarpus 441]|uniref:Uncharacterized protein n=1 Tax=Pisolithus microcarpus 441 TaxID=765257 RepID=A0A0C9YWU8_9AGAM|nr:hypothetical protein PISMIDRAFT_547493 [Pisolithus microcarpus 441]